MPGFRSSWEGRTIKKPQPRGLQPLRHRPGKESCTPGLGKDSWVRQARGRVDGSSDYGEEVSHRGSSRVVRSQDLGEGDPGLSVAPMSPAVVGAPLPSPGPVGWLHGHDLTASAAH